MLCFKKSGLALTRPTQKKHYQKLEAIRFSRLTIRDNLKVITEKNDLLPVNKYEGLERVSK